MGALFGEDGRRWMARRLCLPKTVWQPRNNIVARRHRADFIVTNSAHLRATLWNSPSALLGVLRPLLQELMPHAALLELDANIDVPPPPWPWSRDHFRVGRLDLLVPLPFSRPSFRFLEAPLLHQPVGLDLDIESAIVVIEPTVGDLVGHGPQGFVLGHLG